MTRKRIIPVAVLCALATAGCPTEPVVPVPGGDGGVTEGGTTAVTEESRQGFAEAGVADPTRYVEER